MTAVKPTTRALLTALALAVVASPAGAATRVFVSGIASEPQICGDSPACVAASISPVAHTRGAHSTAAAATTHTALHAKAPHRRHRLHRAHATLAAATLRAGSHSAPPSPAHPAHSAPAHRAPAPATPRLDAGKTAQNRYRSLQGAAAFSPPASLTRAEAAVLLAVHSDLFVPRSLDVEEGRGPPRAGPLSTFAAATVPFHSRSSTPHRTASPPVPTAPDDTRRTSARPSRAPAFLASSACFAGESFSFDRARSRFALSPLRTVDPRRLAWMTRVANHPGVRRPEGTAPHFPQLPSILGGLT